MILYYFSNSAFTQATVTQLSNSLYTIQRIYYWRWVVSLSFYINGCQQSKVHIKQGYNTVIYGDIFSDFFLLLSFSVLI